MEGPKAATLSGWMLVAKKIANALASSIARVASFKGRSAPWNKLHLHVQRRRVIMW
jgi:hypothetical protein